MRKSLSTASSRSRARDAKSYGHLRAHWMFASATWEREIEHACRVTRVGWNGGKLLNPGSDRVRGTRAAMAHMSRL